MRGGQLRNVVLLQVETETKDRLGQPIQTWTDVGAYRAWVRYLTGREAIIARQVVATATHAVTMRYLGPGVPITTKHRIVFRGRNLGIVASGDPDSRLRQIDILCQEQT